MGERIKALRLAKSMTQQNLVDAVRKLNGDLSQPQLSAIENGDSERPRALREIAAVLGTTYEGLEAERNLQAPTVPNDSSVIDAAALEKLRVAISHNPELLQKLVEGTESIPQNVGGFLLSKRGARSGRNSTRSRLPVWASAEGGQGAWIVDDHPIAWVERPDFLDGVVGAFAVRLIGDSASPKYEHDDVLLINTARLVKAGDWCLFLKEHSDSGTFAAVKKLVRSTGKAWVVSQLNPVKQFDLPKAEWGKAYKVVGVYTDR